MTPGANDDDPPSGRADTGLDEAEELLDDFLARLEEGETLDFSTFARQHPEHESQLRELYEGWSRLDARLETALPEPVLGEESFFQSVGWSVAGPGALQLPAGHAEARPGAVIGEYRLIRLLGQGGMGQVWEADQETLGRRVALKLIRPDKFGRDVVRQLSREARASSRLDHPCIVTVYAAGEADGVPYIAQQLVGTGFHLGDAIARLRDAQHPVSPDYRKLAILFAHVADAVATAHAAGVLHRDLKPQNILIGANDVPAITDFGLAHVSGDDGTPAKPGLVGTYPYMSPEQAAGKGALDARSDVFSLGAVFYEALTLRRAFEGDTAGQILERIQRHDPPDARVLRSRVPRDLAVICAKALAKSPSERYSSMTAFADDLRRYLAHEPIHARPEGALRSSWKWVARHPALSTGIVLSTVALVTISLLLVREVDLRRTAEQERERANQHDYLATLRAGQQHIARREFQEARRRLMSSSEDRRGWEWGHEALRADMSVATWRVLDGPLKSASLSADGATVATSGEDGVVGVWDVASQSRRASWTIANAGTGPLPIALSADGSTVVVGTSVGRVVHFEVATQAVRIEHDHGSPVRAVAVSADGSKSASGGEDGTTLVWNEEPEPLRELSPLVAAPIVSLAMSADGARVVTGNENGIVEDWSIADGGVIGLNWYERGPTYVAITQDGTHVFGGKADGTLVTWDLHALDAGADKDDARVVRSVGTEAIEGLSVSGDGSRVITIGERGRALRLWNVGDAQPLAELTGLPGRAVCVTFARDGSHLIAGSDSGHLTMFDGGTRSGDVVLPGFPGTVTAVAVNRDGTRLVSATTPSSRVLVWTQDSSRPPRRLVGHSASVVAVAMDASGQRAVSGGFDTSVRVWDVDRGETLAVLEGHTGGIEALAVDEAATRIVSASRDETVRLWQGPEWADVDILDQHEAVVLDVDISADGRTVVSSSLDGTIVVWVPDDGTTSLLEQNEWFHDGVVAISADGRRIATASMRDDMLRIYEIDDGNEASGPRFRPVVERRASASALAISVHGERLVSASFNDDVVRVWDVRNGEALALLDGHTEGVECVAMSGDGTRVVSGSSDQTVRLWESTLSGARALWRALDDAASR